MTKPRIFLSPPTLSGDERDLVEEVFQSNYLAPVGEMLDRFESDFSRATAIPHCLALNSGTAALHLALRCAGVSSGDDVWVSSMNFIGGVSPIRYLGAEPVFFDADPATWTLDPNLVETSLKKAASKNNLPKVLLATDLYGQCADLDTLTAICLPFEIPVLADSAEALGATYRGRHAGAGSASAVFSFNGNKIVTTSGGGMLASDNPDTIEQARFLATQARDPAPHYEHTTLGYNYRMSNLLAAVGRGQLRTLKDRVARKRDLFETYKKLLGELPGLSFMPEAFYGESSRWLTTILIDARLFGTDRERLRTALEKEGIESRPLWKPMHLQPVFSENRMMGGQVCEQLFEQGLCLPSGLDLTTAHQEEIASIIKACAL